MRFRISVEIQGLNFNLYSFLVTFLYGANSSSKYISYVVIKAIKGNIWVFLFWLNYGIPI